MSNFSSIHSQFNYHTLPVTPFESSHRYNPLVQSVGTISWYNPLVQSVGTIRWYNPLVQSVQLVLRIDNMFVVCSMYASTAVLVITILKLHLRDCQLYFN